MAEALLVIDMTNDFVEPNGALPVPGAVDIIPGVQRAVEYFVEKGRVLFCNDSHNKNDLEFDEYPEHCVSGTYGAGISERFKLNFNPTVVEKVTFSAFSNDLLDGILKSMDIHDLYICGVATEVCIKQTVWSARDLGYKTHVLVDCIAGLDIKAGDSAEALMMMGYWEADPVKAYGL